MKRVFKVLGIIALVAVIGFGFVSCDDDDSGGGGGDTGVKWPSELAYRESESDGDKVWTGIWTKDTTTLTFTTVFVTFSNIYANGLSCKTDGEETTSGGLTSVGAGTFTILYKTSSYDPGTNYTISYSVSGNTLNINNAGGCTWLTTGAYTKQP
jgi:hypothetical protein